MRFTIELDAAERTAVAQWAMVNPDNPTVCGIRDKVERAVAAMSTRAMNTELAAERAVAVEDAARREGGAYQGSDWEYGW